jgi:hypothetical protein
LYDFLTGQFVSLLAIVPSRAAVRDAKIRSLGVINLGRGLVGKFGLHLGNVDLHLGKVGLH